MFYVFLDILPSFMFRPGTIVGPDDLEIFNSYYK